MKRKTPLLLVPLVGLGSLVWLLLRPPLAPPPLVLHPTKHQVAETEKHLTQLGQAVSQPGPNPRTLRLSETDLNVYLAGSKSAHKLLATHGVEAVQIVLQEPADMVIHATVRYRHHTQNIELSGGLTPDVKSGLRFTATKARVGRLPLPPAAATAEANALAARFSRPLFQRLSLSVQSVGVEKKDLVIVALPVRKVSQQSMSSGRH